ncbi:MAG: ornithine cyclodeaminase family protein [Actinomycetia bacterium]|nr:ornithine cyclodeaminase family protein [Actinomycetes bacterium]MCP4962425.1 ornithine cyclodeaminase family protein [Actinomycetes bacterium]
MQTLDAAEIRERTPWKQLIDAIAEELREDEAKTPERHVHPLEQLDGSTGSLLMMPSWRDGDLIAVKVVTYFPANAGSDVPTINAAVLVFDGANGRALAVLDGDELTARRTAAMSALAARYLARSDASRLLVVGTGQLAPNIAQAHASARPIESIEIWGRDGAKAEAVANQLRDLGLTAEPVADLQSSVETADIVSCVTGASSPLVFGDWLRPGAHLDLVGSFRQDMRESDDVAALRSNIFVDTVAGATQAGDLARPIEAGLISETDILSDLRGLVVGDHPGRANDEQITLFKSAGFALADLAATRLAWR